MYPTPQDLVQVPVSAYLTQESPVSHKETQHVVASVEISLFSLIPRISRPNGPVYISIPDNPHRTIARVAMTTIRNRRRKKNLVPPRLLALEPAYVHTYPIPKLHCWSQITPYGKKDAPLWSLAATPFMTIPQGSAV